jgi:hypothetical protein
LKIDRHLIFIALLTAQASFGQKQSRSSFSFFDKYGCSIKVQSLPHFPKPVDSLFIATNINGKLIEPALLIDTTVNSYSFTIYEVSSLDNHVFNLKIHIEILSLANKTEKDTTTIYLGHKKRHFTSGYNIYSMTLKMVGDKFAIKTFNYIKTEI